MFRVLGLRMVAFKGKKAPSSVVEVNPRLRYFEDFCQAARKVNNLQGAPSTTFQVTIFVTLAVVT